jgi:hypothetical protein
MAPDPAWRTVVAVIAVILVTAATLPAVIVAVVAAVVAVAAPAVVVAAAVIVVAEVFAMVISLVLIPAMIGHGTGSGHTQCNQECQYCQPASAHKCTSGEIECAQRS